MSGVALVLIIFQDDAPSLLFLGRPPHNRQIAAVDSRMQSTTEQKELTVDALIAWPPTVAKNRLRRAEEIQYWRRRSGWFDDDESMRDYNKGVYDTYYEVDDDVNGSHTHKRVSGKQNVTAKTVLKVLAALVAIGLLILMLRAIMGRFASSKKDKNADPKVRSGKTSSRSRSHSRTRKAGSEYNLMEEDDTKSRRSRSKSRSGRPSRSRSRQRSSSRTRTEKKRTEGLDPVLLDPVLV